MSDPKWMAKVEQTVGRAAAWSYRNAIRSLAIAAVITLAGFLLSTRLSLNADMSSLLPETFESVKDLSVLREKFGGMGYVVVVGEGAEPDVLRRFADDMAPKIEALENIRFVEYQRATDFFADRALYYLSTDDLSTIRDRIKERERYERRMKNPMFVKLDDDEPVPSLDMSDITRKYAGSSQDRLAGTGERYYLDAGAKLVALLAKPAGTSVDLAYAKEIVGQVEGLVKSQDLSRYPGLKVSMTGTYKKKIDQQEQITSDVAMASSAAMVMMILYLAFHFRSLMGIALVIGPTTAGLFWTYGFVAIAYGQVNLLTAFLGAILGGLGTEHGIHIFGRYTGLKNEGLSGEDAIREAFIHTGGSALISSLVAALTFASLTISDFSAFREFGAIAAVGMIVIVFAYILIYPATIGVAARLGWNPRSREAISGERSELSRFIPAHPWPIAIAMTAVLAILMVRIPHTRFDYNLGTLEDSTLPSFRLDQKVNRILGYSQTPLVLFTETSAQERSLVDQLNAKKKSLGEASTIDFAAALDDLVPPDQEAKKEILDAIAKILKKVKRDSLDEATRKDFDGFKRMAAVAPFVREDIPQSIRRQFEGVAGDGGFVLAFPGISLSDGSKVTDLAKEVRGLELPGAKDGEKTRISAVGEALILADIIDMVTREAAPVLIAAVVLVLLAMWITMGSLRSSLICMLPTVVSILGLVGLMDFADIDFNFLNIVAIPILIGTTVDAGVHLISRFGESSGTQDDFCAVYAETGRAICGGLITSAVGFGAMIIAAHPGLASLGKLTILGFALNLTVMILAFPALLIIRKRLESGAGGEGSDDASRDGNSGGAASPAPARDGSSEAA